MVYDFKDDIPVYYVTYNPKLLSKHAGVGEIVKPVSKSRLERTWVLEDEKGKALCVKRGVTLATTKKFNAQELAKDCILSVTPTLVS